MPSLDNRLHNSRSRSDKLTPSLGLLSTENKATTPLPVPGPRSLPDPAMEETNILPAQLTPFPAALTTQQLPYQPETMITRKLASVLSKTKEAVARRSLVVIKGQEKQTLASIQAPPIPHHKRRLYVTVASIVSLCLIISLALLTVTPLGHDLTQIGNPQLSNNISMVNDLNDNPQLVAQATATAVYHQQTDGYDPNAGAGQIIGNGAGSLDWPLGQCTYWANARYHQLTGYWVSWSGNADQWVAGAQAAGWNVSTSPHVPSVIVLMPGVQGASGYGHVAVVESIVASATPGTTPTVETVYTSNMNWWTNGGGWDRVSYVDFTVGSGVYFIWHS